MDNQEKIIEAFTEMTPRYEEVVDSELNRFWGWRYTEFIAQLVQPVAVKEQELVLDIATGTGNILTGLQAKGMPSHNLHGLDITFSMLKRAQQRLVGTGSQAPPALACASAMAMPYKRAAFTHVLCGLATHHMQVRQLVQECQRVLRPGGRLSLADAGASPLWKIPGVKLLLKLAAFLYFSRVENRTRAWAEVSAVANVYTPQEWRAILGESGFHDITIQKMHSRFFLVPAPLLINAVKNEES
jgi:ubiquinone/menaquinone biosynthesis C-methylase UbiE